ncbi:MAG: hypothetical protein KDA86_17675 [Planctomycetaceae bacterium]|nr:hypothetical protein [Planctomycetaceae bacterium]
MAARKSRHSSEQPLQETMSPEGGTPLTDHQVGLQSKVHETASFPRLVIALVVFLAWATSLVTMAVFVTGPVTLNRDQILRADVVVQGTIDPAKPGTFLVERTWPARATDEVLLIDGLAELRLNAGESTLIPLRRSAERLYEIVLTPKPSELPLTYPATEDTIATLDTILSSDTR